ncbi:MAG: hypothetical protein Q7R40_14280 [Phaeospirillum sp.]|nr:hypothetical protein [Phaeospirillum sp.]
MKIRLFVVLTGLALVVSSVVAEPEEGSALQRVRDGRIALAAAMGALPRAAGVKTLDLEPGKTRFSDVFTATAGLESAVQGYLAFARDPQRAEEKLEPTCAVTARLTERAGRFAPLAQILSVQLVEAVQKAAEATQAGTEGAHELMLDEALAAVQATLRLTDKEGD